MSIPSLHAHAQYLIDEIILPFYAIQRDMRIPTEDNRQENDAEHSWSLNILACSLASQIDPSLDIGLVSQFAAVHDLAEIQAGDTSVWASQEELAAKPSKESNATETLAERCAMFPWLVDTLAAYERQDTPEARFVRSLDKYIALSIRFRDGGAFYREQQITKENFDTALETHRTKAHGHTGAAELYEIMRTEYDKHPEHFYTQTT